MSKLLYVCYALLLLGVVACTPGKTEQKKEKNMPKHIILVGFDGWSADCMNQGANMPVVRKLMAEGSSTLENRSILPSSSAPNWASMFMGAGPELHGYTTWGSQSPDLPARLLNKYGMFPNIFGLYRDKAPDAEIGYIFEWGGMNYLVDTLAINYRLHAEPSEQNPGGCLMPAIEYIKTKKPNFCAVIFDQPDGVGHSLGWDSPEYFAKISQLDSCLGKIVDAVNEAGIMDETVIIVTADHGGKDRNHGGKTMKEMQTPIVFYGKGIKKGFKIPESTMVYDIAATIGYMFNVEQPQVWIARPITSVFE